MLSLSNGLGWCPNDAVFRWVTLFRGSSAGSGGCLENYGSLELRGVRFEACVAAAGFGGGLYNSGVVFAHDSVFSQCTADKFGGGVHSSGAGSRFEGTKVEVSDCNVFNGDGAGVYNKGGVVLLVDSVVARNRVAKRWAGGVWNEAGLFEATNTSIVENWSFRYGGGVHNHNGGTFRCLNCYIARNRAAEGAGFTSKGALVELIDSRLEANVADYDGGGLAVLGSTVSLVNVSATLNKAARGGFAFVYGALVCDGVEAFANVATDGAAVYLGDDGASVRAAPAAPGGFGLELHSYDAFHERGTISVGPGASQVVLEGVTSTGSKASQGAFLFVHPSASVTVDRSALF